LYIRDHPRAGQHNYFMHESPCRSQHTANAEVLRVRREQRRFVHVLQAQQFMAPGAAATVGRENRASTTMMTTTTSYSPKSQSLFNDLMAAVRDFPRAVLDAGGHPSKASGGAHGGGVGGYRSPA
jgi:hypothetical protein